MKKLLSLVFLLSILYACGSKNKTAEVAEKNPETPKQLFILANESSNRSERATFENCKEDFAGKRFGPNGEFCAVSKKYFVLKNESHDGQVRKTFENCETVFKGKNFGTLKEFCAVTIQYSILENRGGITTGSFTNCQEEFGGIVFGPMDEFCAVVEEVK